MNLFHFRLTKINLINLTEIAKIKGKSQISRKNYAENSIQNKEIQFQIPYQVRKLHIKLRKALFKRGLEINGKNKNILEFDVEKEMR